MAYTKVQLICYVPCLSLNVSCKGLQSPATKRQVSNNGWIIHYGGNVMPAASLLPKGGIGMLCASCTPMFRTPPPPKINFEVRTKKCITISASTADKSHSSLVKCPHDTTLH